MENTEYDFSEYKEQLDHIRDSLQLGYEDAYQELVAFDNTVTSLESTRYPGNTELLRYRKEARELLAK